MDEWRWAADGPEGWRHGPRPSDEFSRRVRSAMCAADWLAHWTASAAAMDFGGPPILASGCIRIGEPTARLLVSLDRSGRLLGMDREWELAGAWVGCVAEYHVMQSACSAAARLLDVALGEEAAFTAYVRTDRP